MAGLRAAYERRYGKGPRRYAEKAYGRWKTGAVQMSGEVSERLLKFLPMFLGFEDQYRLVSKLWRGYRRPSRLRVVVSRQGGLEACLATVAAAASAVDQQAVPPAVLDGLAWLADSEDAVAARASLLHQVLLREGQITADAVRAELRLLFNLAAGHPDTAVRAERVVELPSVTLEIVLADHAAKYQRSRAMTQANDCPQGRELVPTEPPRHGPPAVPIQSAGDLLDQAFQHLPQERIDGLVAKAAEEAMRLQVMLKEGEVEKAVIGGKAELLIDTVRQAAGGGPPTSGRRPKPTTRGRNGDTHILITSEAAAASRSRRPRGRPASWRPPASATTTIRPCWSSDASATAR